MPAAGDVSTPAPTDGTITPSEDNQNSGSLPALQAPAPLQGLPDPNAPTTTGAPITLETPDNTLPETITTTNAADVSAPSTLSTIPGDGTEITPPDSTVPPVVGTTPTAGPLEVTPPETLAPTVPPITTDTSPLEVTPPDGWKPAPGASVDPLGCPFNMWVEPLCGGNPPPPASVPKDPPPDDNDGAGSNDGTGQDNTTGGAGNPTPTTNPNGDDASEQDAYDKAYNDLSNDGLGLSKDEIEDHINAHMEVATKIMKGLNGNTYELSPKAKIIIYQSISYNATKEGTTGEDITTRTKELKEIPVQAILPTVGPPGSPGMTTQPNYAGGALGLGATGLIALNTAFPVLLPATLIGVATGVWTNSGDSPQVSTTDNSNGNDDAPPIPGTVDFAGTPGPGSDCPPGSGIPCTGNEGQGRYEPTGPMQGKKINHTFTKHGSHNTNELYYEAINSRGGVPQGQWLDDVAAEKLIADNLSLLKNGSVDVPIPQGLGRVFMPDGSVIPATAARLVPSGSGVWTAFPIP